MINKYDEYEHKLLKLYDRYSEPTNARWALDFVTIIKMIELKAKQEVLNDKEFDLVRDTNKFKKIKKRHILTFKKKGIE